MSAASPPPAPRSLQPLQPSRHAAAEGWLTPRHWSLVEEPPGADLRTSPASSGEAPLLLLIDRQRLFAADQQLGAERQLAGERPLVAERLLAAERQLAASLSPDERQRQQAYRLAGDRERFLLARAALRRLLGAWHQLPPEAVPLRAGPHGKPLCPIGPQFNVSHSGDLILLALHPSRPVGVDVERLRPDLDWPAIARRVLLPAELEAIESLPVAERPEGFLASWCRLEARLKARGLGLAGLQQLRAQEQVLEPQQQREQERLPEPEPQPGPTQPSSGSWRGDPASTDLPWAGERPSDRPIQSRSESRSPAREQLWNVHVPSGYRAAVALAPQSP